MKTLMLGDKICFFRVYPSLQRSSEKLEPQNIKDNILIHDK